MNNLQSFESAACESRAVINRPLGEVQRMAAGDSQLSATYYSLVEAEMRIPADDRWDVLRALADELLFPGYKQHIRFAALTLDETGLRNYGECAFTLREDMIAHRATVFQENSVAWARRLGLRIDDVDRLPAGFRAVWEARGRLAVAKLGSQIEPGTPRDAFPGLLLRSGRGTEDDEFIEVHVWGPISRRTMERVTLSRGTTRASRVIERALRARLAEVDVDLEIVA